jgi:hypothetical protein
MAQSTKNPAETEVARAIPEMNLGQLSKFRSSKS